MQTIVLVIHVLIAIALIGVVLIQKSEGGGLGMGASSGGGMSGLMTGRSSANLLTRVTGGLFAAFVLTSITLSVFAAHRHGATNAALDHLVESPATVTTPIIPPAPKGPSVPLAQ